MPRIVPKMTVEEQETLLRAVDILTKFHLLDWPEPDTHRWSEDEDIICGTTFLRIERDEVQKDRKTTSATTTFTKVYEIFEGCRKEFLGNSMDVVEDYEASEAA